MVALAPLRAMEALNSEGALGTRQLTHRVMGVKGLNADDAGPPLIILIPITM